MYDGIDFKPPAGAAKAAQKAIDWKKEHGDAVQGGTQVGWTRASQLVKGDPLSPETVKRMYKFFQRHQKNKAVKPEHKDEPWRDNGYVAWLIWGGDAGKSWAETKWGQMERAEKKTAARIVGRVLASAQPLRDGPDYGEKGHRPQDFTEDELVDLARQLAAAVNPYLNTPPTELRRDLESEKDPAKRKKMQDALNAWRLTTPGPFWRSQSASDWEETRAGYRHTRTGWRVELSGAHGTWRVLTSEGRAVKKAFRGKDALKRAMDFAEKKMR
jgi:hypothetical protein